MRPAAVALVLAWVVLRVTGCSEETGPPAPQYVEEGDPCHTDFDKRCLDDSRLFHCVERTWTVSSCDALCGERSPAFASGICATNEFTIEQCQCSLADPQGCTPGDFRCTDEETIGKCDDTQQWIEHACVDLCGEEQPSLGCRSEPTACVCGL